ncbi:hypothetical protein BKA67DRAFT_580181 [Truncatella angustata]|uniref:Uncharacterized protein n=1 Tax=Truncatella angustata TaxID=152316 RepID=A0A9P8UBX6_9PEZI|nr:uncharacterized protein BKA67DRAFT_580181 [Truncatella angustata]KAH6646667.1 hypothetical protein BKA67DRAFT_580181 [Truncatella angustata]
MSHAFIDHTHILLTFCSDYWLLLPDKGLCWQYVCQDSGRVVTRRSDSSSYFGQRQNRSGKLL